jgi:hypothetical protein
MAETPEYVLTTDTFIEPNLLKAGTRIRYAGPYGPHMEPTNDAGREAADAYYKANPGASLAPVEQLPVTFAEVVSPPSNAGDGTIDLSATIAGAQIVQATPQDADVKKK